MQGVEELRKPVYEYYNMHKACLCVHGETTPISYRFSSCRTCKYMVQLSLVMRSYESNVCDFGNVKPDQTKLNPNHQTYPNYRHQRARPQAWPFSPLVQTTFNGFRRNI